MERAALVLAILAASAPEVSAAGTELPPIVIAPFANRCFDAADLAERVRAQLPAAVVIVGAPSKGAQQLVRVEGDGVEVNIRLRLRNQRRQIVGTDERELPLGEDCVAAAETAALIVVRAATPLAFRAPPRPPGSSHPSENRTSESRTRAASDNRTAPPSESRTTSDSHTVPSDNRTAPPSESRPEPPPESRTAERPTEAPPAPLPNGSPAASDNRTKAASDNRTKAASDNRTKAASDNRTRAASDNRTAAASDNRTGTASDNRTVTTLEPRAPPRLEIDVVAMWSFPLDGAPSTPAGDLTIGWRWRLGRRLHLGVGARTGVSAAWTATSASVAGPITVSARRIPVSLELRLDVEAPRGRGAVRISAGPQAAVWLASSTGLPRPGSAVIAQPGAFVRIAYRLQLGPVALQAGADLDVAFVRDSLTVGGVGQVARTPGVLLSPFAGAGVGFL